MANKDLLLTAEIVGGVVTITVGVSSLCQIVRDSARCGYFCGEPVITDEYAAARGVVAALNGADGGGPMTRMHLFLAEAAKVAVDDGTDGIHVPDLDGA